MSGVELIKQERDQLNVDGLYVSCGELVVAAIYYGQCARYQVWGMDRAIDRAWEQIGWPQVLGLVCDPKDKPIDNLVKAGALIAAEIDRLQRAAKPGDR